MIHNLIKVVDKAIGLPTAAAHCDIPCKVYDPGPALIAALGVVRMIDIMEEAADKGGIAGHNTLTRCVMQKEEEAEKVKHEIRVIWGDYFKAPQIEKHPDIHELTHKIMMAASAGKQGVDRAKAVELVELVNQFAEKFWDTKDVKTERKTSPYPPSLDVVYPVL